jgi:hypothetical protein
VAEYYQKTAARDLADKSRDAEKLIGELKKQGRETDIQTELKKAGYPQGRRKTCVCRGAAF